MRIILVNNYWYIRGGAERAVFATMELLERAGHTVAIFGMQHPDNVMQSEYFAAPVDIESARGFAKVRAAVNAVYNTNARNQFAKLVHDFRPDVVHLHNVYHHLSFSILDVVKREHIPTVMTLHDYKIINPNYTLFRSGRVDERGGRGQYRDTFLYNTLGSYSRSFVAMIEAYLRVWRFSGVIAKFIAPSRFMKSMCVENGIPSDRIEVVSNPFVVAKTTSIAEDAEPYVLYVGRLAEEKGIETLLSAARRTPRIRYVLVGSGPLLTRVREIVKRDNLQNVGLVGQAQTDMVEHFIAGASLVLVPSIWYENYPYAIVEAKAAGKVVVASRIGGIPELLPDDCLVAPGNSESLAAVIEAWMHKTPEERALRGAALRHEVVLENDPDRYTKRLLALYANIMPRATS